MWTPEEQRRAGEIANASAIASLVVSLIALVLAYQAWTRPVPADPTRVPTWGEPARPRMIDSTASAQSFFDFLDNNAGRRVRLFLQLSDDYVGGVDGARAPNESGFHLISSSTYYTADGSNGTGGGDPCPDYRPDEMDEALTDRRCIILQLQILDVGPERPGLYLEHGNWELTGYFADVGFVGIWQATAVYSIKPLTAEESVS